VNGNTAKIKKVLRQNLQRLQYWAKEQDSSRSYEGKDIHKKLITEYRTASGTTSKDDP